MSLRSPVRGNGSPRQNGNVGLDAQGGSLEISARVDRTRATADLGGVTTALAASAGFGGETVGTKPVNIPESMLKHVVTDENGVPVLDSKGYPRVKGFDLGD